MQIVVLGNGFDKASGLPTLYEEFFNWRIEQIKDDVAILFEKYEAMLMQPVKHTPIVGNQEYYKMLHELTVSYESKSYSYHTILQELREIIKEFPKKGINYMDMYFYIAKRNSEKFENWYDVEGKLKKIISNINSITNDGESSIQRITVAYGTNKGNLEVRKIYDLFLTLYFEGLSDSFSREKKYEILKLELLSFEKVFKKYISSIYETILKNNQYKNIYYGNFKTIAGEETTHLLNFNYTSITNTQQKANDRLKEVNVHGRYDGNIIFGVEQIACETDSEYIFSKTYRKIEDYSVPQMLPRNRPSHVEHQKIIFYGHSLSEADYSYFQSIFDLYDIYNQTTLVFKYSIYDEKERSKIAGRTFSAVTKLLQNYGGTMSNTNHGKNLVHKLLLEGRIILEEIELNDMKFTFEDTNA